MTSTTSLRPRSQANAVEAGQRIGRWTVLGDTMRTSAGETKWLCRCDCGTERYVLDRALRYGGSVS